MKTVTRLNFAGVPGKRLRWLVPDAFTPRPIHDKVDFENVSEITDAMAGYKADGSREDYDPFCRPD